MSETIIGFVKLITGYDLITLEREVRKETPFGFKFLDELTLYNYPESLLNRSDIIQFVISDSNDSNIATILLEEENYDPCDESENDFQRKFPPTLEKRVLEIFRIIKCLSRKKCVLELGFSISFCDQIEQIKYSPIGTLEELLVVDCKKSCPPNALYIIEAQE